MSIIDDITKDSTSKKIPRFKAGDTVRVFLKIKEGEKERVQYYEGVVIGIHNNGISSTFKVRKESYGVGVERTFPLFSPLIQKIEVKRRGDVRRAKLYYLRKLSGKKARIKEKKDWMLKKSDLEAREAELAAEEAPPVGEEAALATSVEAADREPSEMEAEAAATEETAEIDGTEDAAAEVPVIEKEKTEVEKEVESEGPVTADDISSSTEEDLLREASKEKEEKTPTAETKTAEKEPGKKPRGKKKS